MHTFVLSSNNAKGRGNLEKLFNWKFYSFFIRMEEILTAKKCNQNATFIHQKFKEKGSVSL